MGESSRTTIESKAPEGAGVLPQDAAALTPAGQRAAAEVLWIDKFLARKQSATESTRNTAGVVAAPTAVPTAPPTALPTAPPTASPGSVSTASIPTPPTRHGGSSHFLGAGAPEGRAPATSDVSPEANAEKATAVAQAAVLERLTCLPSAVTEQLDALGDTDAPISDALLRAVWIALESNTRAVSADWEYVDSRYGYVAPDLTTAVGDAGDALLARFGDILPPKATAVLDPIRSAEYGGSRYLHANAVDLDCDLPMIAAQKPVLGEIAGLHQILIDRQVGLIVDLTRYQERENHAVYAPEQQGTCVSARGRQRLVCCTARSRLRDLKATRQQLAIDDGSQVTRLQRLRFPGWPDHGVIAVGDLIALADTIEMLHADSRRPVLMHCLAGVGRTGTLMSFIAARRRLLKAGRPGRPCPPAHMIRILLDTIARGRLARGPSFVQIEEQFMLLVQALQQGCSRQSVQQPGVPARKTTADGVALLQAHAVPPLDDEASPRPNMWQRLRSWCGLG